MGTLSCMWAAGGLVVGFLYDTGALDTPHSASAPSCHLHAPTYPPQHLPCRSCTVGWRWLNVGSAGFAALAFVYNSLLPTPPLQKAGPKQKSEGLSKALCSAEFASHAWTAFNMGWSVPSLQPSVSRQAGWPRSIQAEPYV